MERLFLVCFSFFFFACSSNNSDYDKIIGKKNDGSEFKMKDQNGVKVINIWGTWCADCIVELDALNRVSKQFENNLNVHFIAITDESMDKVNRLLSKRNFNYTHVVASHNAKEILIPTFIKTIPHHLVLNQRNNIVYEQSGRSLALEDSLVKYIHLALKE